MSIDYIEKEENGEKTGIIVSNDARVCSAAAADVASSRMARRNRALDAIPISISIDEWIDRMSQPLAGQ